MDSATIQKRHPGAVPNPQHKELREMTIASLTVRFMALLLVVMAATLSVAYGMTAPAHVAMHDLSSAGDR
jgi:hypothetical protein